MPAVIFFASLDFGKNCYSRTTSRAFPCILLRANLSNDRGHFELVNSYNYCGKVSYKNQRGEKNRQKKTGSIINRSGNIPFYSQDPVPDFCPRKSALFDSGRSSDFPAFFAAFPSRVIGTVTYFNAKKGSFSSKEKDRVTATGSSPICTGFPIKLYKHLNR